MGTNNFIHTQQYRSHDCGLACASSILKYYGYDFGIDYLRDLIIDKKGYNLKDLVSIFKSFGTFTCKAFEVNKEKLVEVFDHIDKPSIALVKVDNNNDQEGHYIVIYQKKGLNLIISDPQKKTLTKLPIDEFNKNFTGILLVIEHNGSTSEANYKDKNSKINIIKDFILNNKLFVSAIFFCSLVIVFVAVIVSLFLKSIVDFIIPMYLYDMLNIIALMFLGANILRVIFSYLRNHFIIKLSCTLDKKISDSYFNKITKLPIRFFKNRDDGEIISRFDDSIYIRTIFSTNVIAAVLDLIIILGIGTVLYKINQTLFLTTLLPLLLLVTLTILFYETLDKKNKELMQSRANTTSFLVQFIKNMPTIYAFNKKDYFLKSFKEIYSNQLDAMSKEMKVVSINDTLKILVQTSFSIIVLWVGAQQVLNDSITLGTLLLISSLVSFMMGSLDSLISIQSELQKAFVAAERYSEIINYPVNSPTQQMKKLDKVKKIEFKNFTYSFDHINNTFENVSASFYENEKILLAGKSGVGKSTLVQSLVKFYNIKNSMVFVNEIDINYYDHNELRKEIIYLNEHPFLFKGTIKENLCMGADFTEDEIIIACHLAGIYEHIASLPKGLQYYLNEQATNLSTGQRQRLSLARAILHKPSVLILDESLSNVDPESLKVIVNNLLSLDCMIIFISHNIEFVANFDRKFILENNSLIEISGESPTKVIQKQPESPL
ncbi:ATP-binding cassette subfamily C protein [Laceyella sacchari]|uniref:peptidase domain-containing ABC transporter n=1 Tax=Laceyella sacchari TaxID=37482 RepID=UPI00104D01D4|nr:peptidase domain-containing ABC transporter [Laceyella sacchari]TCW40590.1 ATP-binding cassette subfamily C protein [Laceyella sacchari]